MKVSERNFRYSLNDAAEAVEFILVYLRLPGFYNEEIKGNFHQNLLRIYQFTASSVSILFLRLVSFAGSQLFDFGASLENDVFSQLQIKMLDGVT